MYEEFRVLAVKMGATEAKVVRTKDVFTGEWVRLKCRYGCEGWGGCLTCPPHSPTPAETRKVLDEYKDAILIHCARPAKASGAPAPRRGSGAVWPRAIVPELERAVFLAGYYKAFGYASGPCDLCDRCNLERCIHPDKARPAMEASGIDVFATARKAGFPIEVVVSRECARNFFGLVLIE